MVEVQRVEMDRKDCDGATYVFSFSADPPKVDSSLSSNRVQVAQFLHSTFRYQMLMMLLISIEEQDFEYC